MNTPEFLEGCDSEIDAQICKDLPGIDRISG